MPRMALIFCLWAVAASSPAATEVYQWIDDEGVLHFSDQPPDLTVAKRVVVREPNLVDPVASAPATRKPPRQHPRVAVSREQVDEREARCESARTALRELRRKRRKGYSLSEERALDRAHDEAMAAIRLSCRGL